MESATFRCACCRRIKRRNPRVKNQKYCGEAECQRERKRKWQRNKMSSDPEYHFDQREAQRLWKQNNPDYWKSYRNDNTEVNRRDRQSQQKGEETSQPANSSARKDYVKMDTLERIINETAKTYLISPEQGSFVKMDALKVKIIPVTTR